MMKIVFATNNKHKLEEIRQILGPQFEVLSLSDIGCHEDIPETGRTLEENALQKARYVYDHYHVSCFADDTGLEVDALGGRPGVFSARYANVMFSAAMPQNTGQEAMPQNTGQEGQAGQARQVFQERPQAHDSEANMTQLLGELAENNNRKARFRTIIALLIKHDVCPCGCTSVKEEHLFEGIVEGEITHERSGAAGFGYDPVFRPSGYSQTFAELGNDIKNQISHRARATQKLAEFLLNNTTKR